MPDKYAASDAVIDCLLEEDVQFAFGIASGKLSPLFRSLSTHPEIRFIGVRHEASAAHMAAGMFAGTGQIALALGEIGPGSGNLVSGIASAFNNNLPLIAITSGNATHLTGPNRGMMMEMDVARIMAPITKFSVTVTEGQRVPEIMRAAFREAFSGRPGPVHINIPADILAGHYAYPDLSLSRARYRQIEGPAPHPAAIERAARLLTGAERPLMIAGGGVVAAHAAPAFVSVANLSGAATTATQMGIGSIPTDHENFVGHGGIIGGPALLQALDEADVVLAVGCRFSSWLWDAHGPRLSQNAKLVHVDTDPTTIGRLVPVEIGMVADAKAALLALETALAAQKPVARAWTQDLNARWRAYRHGLAADAGPVSGVMHPAALSQAIAEALPDNALVVYDGGHTSFWSNDIIAALGPRSRFHEPGMAQLGFGTPYALALKARYPDRMVVNITGDGSFGFTIQELDTARRYGLNTMTIIHNNATWGVIEAGQQRAGFKFGTALQDTDYAAIARGFGCHGATVSTPEALGPALEAAAASGLPAVIDCRVAFVPHPSMPYFGAIGKGHAESA